MIGMFVGIYVGIYVRMCDGTRCIKEFLIVPGGCGVHGGSRRAATLAEITLIDPRLSRRHRFPCMPVAISR